MRLLSGLFGSPQITSSRNRFLVLDIGGGFIKGGILNIRKDENGFKGEMIVCKKERRETFFDDHRTVLSYEELRGNILRILSALRGATKEDIPKNAILVCDQLFVSLRSFALKEYREKTKGKIDQGELQSMLQHMYLEMQKQISKESSEEIKIADIQIQELHIDGYKVGDPIGYEGKEVSANLAVTYLPQTTIEILKKIMDELLFDSVSLFSDIFCAQFLYSFGDNASANNSFLIVDIGEYITQVGLVKNGKFVKARYCYAGFSNFIKKIASELQIGFAEAEHVALEYARSGLSAHSYEKIDAILAQEKVLWENGMTIVFEEMGELSKLPAKILFIGGVSNTDLFRKLIAEDHDILSFFEDGEVPDLIDVNKTFPFMDSRLESANSNAYYNIYCAATRFLANIRENGAGRSMRRFIS
jgi:cell division protein FtsA